MFDRTISFPYWAWKLSYKELVLKNKVQECAVKIWNLALLAHLVLPCSLGHAGMEDAVRDDYAEENIELHHTVPYLLLLPP